MKGKDKIKILKSPAMMWVLCMIQILIKSVKLREAKLNKGI